MVSSQIHVLVTCHAWNDDIPGGSFRLATEFAKHLASRGYVVTYLCCAADADAPPEESVQGVRILRYRPSSKRQMGVSRLWHHIYESRRLTMTLNEQCPVQFCSGHSPLQSLGAMMVLDKNRVRLNYTVHSPFDDELSSNSSTRTRGFTQRMAIWAAGMIDRRNCLLAHQVQCDSHYTLSVMTARHRKAVARKGLVAPGWVDSSRFVPTEDRFLLRTQLGDHWSVSCPVFFTLRRLQNRMGLETLVDACQILAQRGVKFRTLIGGGGPLRDALQDRIKEAGLQDNVFLLGRLPEEKLSACYAAADCFVLPTRELECFGLIVLEAFACHTPVIASNVAAIPELAERQGKEWMFEPGEASQLADRMEAFVKQRLTPSADLRAISIEYDQMKVLGEWERVLVGAKSEEQKV